MEASECHHSNTTETAKKRRRDPLDDCCAICTESFVVDGKMRTTVVLACEHAFHTRCLCDLENTTVNTHAFPLCPICRAPFKVWTAAPSDLYQRMSILARDNAAHAALFVRGYIRDALPYLKNAVRTGNAPLIVALAQTFRFDTPCIDGEPACVWAVRNARDAEALKRSLDALVTKGADINALDDEGKSPLLHAMVFPRACTPEFVKAMLDAGASATIADAEHKNTALHVVASYAHGWNVVDTLCKHGANPNAVNACGNTPMFEAIVHGNAKMIQKLADRGADVNDARSTDGCTPLYCAIRTKMETCVSALLAAGADVQKEPFEFPPIMHEAIANGLSASCVAMLVAYGADVHRVNYGRLRIRDTPLHAALRAGSTDIAYTLIALGADVHEEAPDRETTLDLAERVGLDDIAKLLERRGVGRSCVREHETVT